MLLTNSKKKRKPSKHMSFYSRCKTGRSKRNLPNRAINFSIGAVRTIQHRHSLKEYFVKNIKRDGWYNLIVLNLC